MRKEKVSDDCISVKALRNRDFSEAKDLRNHLAQPPEFADEGG